MVTKSKLRLAIAAEKGVDFQKLKEKRKLKAALKQKQAAQAEQKERRADESDDSSEEGEGASEGSDDEENEESYGNGVRYFSQDRAAVRQPLTPSPNRSTWTASTIVTLQTPRWIWRSGYRASPRRPWLP